MPAHIFLLKRMRIYNLVITLMLTLICIAPSYAQDEQLHVHTLTLTSNYSRVALKTNLLFDAILVPNIGVQVNTINNWAIYADVMYAGWDIPTKHYYWDLYGAQIGARKYFGEKSRERIFSGHHYGAYCQALAYDLQLGHIGQQTPTLNIGFGIDYGYSFPITRTLNLDLEVGIGYIGGKYHEYIVDEEHYTWRGTIERNWFGPTKAQVTLVWLIKKSKRSKK